MTLVKEGEGIRAERKVGEWREEERKHKQKRQKTEMGLRTRERKNEKRKSS